jgi:hypothetical protein
MANRFKGMNKEQFEKLAKEVAEYQHRVNVAKGELDYEPWNYDKGYIAGINIAVNYLIDAVYSTAKGTYEYAQEVIVERALELLDSWERDDARLNGDYQDFAGTIIEVSRCSWDPDKRKLWVKGSEGNTKYLSNETVLEMIVHGVYKKYEAPAEPTLDELVASLEELSLPDAN